MAMTLREELHDAARGPAGMTAVLDLLAERIEQIDKRLKELEDDKHYDQQRYLDE